TASRTRRRPGDSRRGPATLEERRLNVAATAAPWDALLAGEELAYLGHEKPRAARLEPVPEAMHPELRSALLARGVDMLYAHQARAFERARAGKHVLVATGTASGKS